MRREKTHSLQYFSDALAYEKGNGTAQNMRPDDVGKRTMEEREKHSSSEKNPKARDYKGHR